MPLYTARGHIDLFYFEFAHKKAQCYYRPFSFDQCYLFFLLSNNPRRRVGFDILIVKEQSNSSRPFDYKMFQDGAAVAAVHISIIYVTFWPRKSQKCSRHFFVFVFIITHVKMRNGMLSYKSSVKLNQDFTC